MRHVTRHAQFGTNAHPRTTFLGSCAGVVSCDDGCSRDVSSPAVSDSTALAVASSALTTRVSVSRANVSQLDRDVFFELVESVTNPGARAVMVTHTSAGHGHDIAPNSL